MKVLLINPSNNGMYPGSPPISLAILASYLRQFGHELKIVDMASGQDYKNLEFSPDIVGITGTTPTILDAYECADYFKELGKRVIMGGAHVSVMPDEALAHADWVVTGEGELAFKIILEEIEKIPIDDEVNLKIKIKGTPIMDLDEIPMPAYDLLNMEFYLSTPMAKLITCLPENLRMGCLLTSRGCPYHCTFCHNSFKNIPYRFNSAKRVVDEIEFLIDKYKIEALFFIEDNFFVNKERVKDVCNLMIERNIKIKWGGNARVDNLDEETLILAKKAGCIQVTFGWESGSQKMLDIYNKKTTVQQNEDSIKICNNVGLMANGTVMVGGPGETIEDMQMTLDFIVNNHITGAVGVCATTPFPGTKMWEDLEKEGKIYPSYINYREFNFSQIPVKCFDMPMSQFMEILNKMRTIAGMRLTQSKLNYEIRKIKL
ncbi:MAG: B12-binding domain-containing radical SAM protein [Chloroflexi bacterium]|nr:B12-binding domain-containing radical SAM protein [Chloroflexota bacterium]